VGLDVSTASGRQHGFAQKPQTSPQITLIALIYTDQKSSNKTALNLQIRVIRVRFAFCAKQTAILKL
jgi:hypothetical protein